MKKLLLLAVLVLSAQFGLKAQTVTFNNATGTYFIGSLHSTTSGSSCNTIRPNMFFYDIPDAFSHTTASIMDEYGTAVTIPTIVGISFQVYRGGPILTCSFCNGNTVVNSGTKTVTSGGFTVVVSWQFVGPNLTITFS